MQTKKIKWLIYTVLVGLIPIFSRLFGWIVTKSGTLEIVAATDFVAFGLVLHISNINEIEHIIDIDTSWKTAQNGTAIIFIALYSVLFSASLFAGDTIDKDALLGVSVVLSLVSLFLSYCVYDYLVHESGG